MNIGRILSKVGSGFAGGFATGGFYGGLTGGATAGFTGGKNKPLKSLAIGAGSGFVGGIAAQKLGLQGSATHVGPYSFRPLSSRVLNFIGHGGPRKPVTQSKTEAKNTTSAPIKSGSIFPALTAPFGAGAFNPGAPGFALDKKSLSDGGGSSEWLPIAVGVGAIYFMGGS